MTVDPSANLIAADIYVERHIEQCQTAGRDPLDTGALTEFANWVEREDPATSRAVVMEGLREAFDDAFRQLAARGLGAYDGERWTTAPGMEDDIARHLDEVLFIGDDEEPQA
jgi:hypothetical protein